MWTSTGWFVQTLELLPGSSDLSLASCSDSPVGGSCAGSRTLLLAGSLSILRVGLAFDSGLVVLRLVEFGSFRAR